MKTLTITFVLALMLYQVAADLKQDVAEFEQKLKTFKKECAAENGIDSVKIDNLDESVFQDKKYRCLLKCIYTKTGFLDTAGNINRELVKQAFGQEMLPKIEKCMAQNSGEQDLCDKVYKVEVCVRQP